MVTQRIYNLGKALFPINRSITGKGTLKSLKLIQKEIPKLKIKKIKSNSKVFDWKIPPEWNVKKAFVKDKFGKTPLMYACECGQIEQVITLIENILQKKSKKKFFKNAKR